MDDSFLTFFIKAPERNFLKKGERKFSIFLQNQSKPKPIAVATRGTTLGGKNERKGEREVCIASD
jgi:hypothetical protein